MAEMEGITLRRNATYVERAMSPHFIVDKRRERDTSREKTYLLNGSGVFKDGHGKIFSKGSSLHKRENTLLSLGQGKNRIEEYSTQAYDLRSLKIKSKASIGEKMKSVHSLLHKQGHHQRVGSMTDHYSRNSESAFDGDTSSALKCSRHPVLTSICEKRAIHCRGPQHGAPPDRHLHGTVRVKYARRFKNKFSTRLDLDPRQSRSGARLEEESPSSHLRPTSGTYYRGGREHSPEDEINLADIYKNAENPKPDYSKFARAFSKTAPLRSDLAAKPKHGYAESQIFGGMAQDDISDKGDTISPNSHSKRSSFKNDAPEADGSQNSSLEVCSPRSPKNGDPPEGPDPEQVVSSKHEAKREQAVADKLAEHRRHIKDEFAAEKGGPNGSIASDDLGGRDVGRKNSKIPVRRVKSILKKSRTNKPSPESSQSKSRGKQVQFNRFKEVLTYYRDKH